MARNRFRNAVANAVLTLLVVASSSSDASSFAFALVHPGQISWHHRSSRRSSLSNPQRKGCGQQQQQPPSPPLLLLLRASNEYVDAAPPKPREEESSPPPPAAAATSAVQRRHHRHTMAILTVPRSASARIANEAILETAISVTTDKLSVVLRANAGGVSDGESQGEECDVSLTRLRRYVGEVYSMAWDSALGLDERVSGESERNKSGEEGIVLAGPISEGGKLLDLIIYPQNMPNSPPEGWIDLRPDLSCICSHDSITGWVTSDAYGAGGSGRRYASGVGQGMGGLREHVEAVNAERAVKGLKSLEALHVDDWPDGAEVKGDPNVVFLEDEDAFEEVRRAGSGGGGGNASSDGGRDPDDGPSSSSGGVGRILGGAAVPPSSLYSSVCVGGTFDGMHYGHRKLLTLAVSSVQPMVGRLLVGVTRDEMLTRKAFAESIPPLEDRMAGVLEFVGSLAPGMMNRVRCVPIDDDYGPPGQPPESRMYPGLENDFDALVLSHETLPTGRKLNVYREEELGLGPLKLLCTQRTEPHGMSSTALRRMRSKK